MAALAKMSNVVPSSRGVRASGELALELEGELGVVGADNGLLVGQLAPLDLTAFASFLTQPLDPGKTEKKHGLKNVTLEGEQKKRSLLHLQIKF